MLFKWEYLKEKDYFVSPAGGNYDEGTNIAKGILLYERCQKCYDLSKEIKQGEIEAEKK